MITRIEIDGFKTFQDFALDLAPFQVIIGPNGCGKSNFFDALDLLSKLADSDLRTAFKGIRGNINELFTVLPNGKSVDCMRFAVEMWVDDSGKPIDRPLADAFWRLRYEIQIERQKTQEGFEHLYISFERVTSLLISTEWLHSYTTIVTPGNFKTSKTTEHLRLVRKPEGEGYVQQVYLEQKYRDDMPPLPDGRSSLQTISFLYMQPGIIRNELRNIRLFRLESNDLRNTSSYVEDQYISSTGENLPATLARMQTEDKHLLKSVSRDVSGIVPNFAQIEVDRDEGRKQIALYAHTRDKRRFSIDALSEGTLRILALATLRNDPQLSGTICFEDPEMGVHPGALERIVDLLRGMATDLNDPEDLKLPLRQVLVTTHSPELVSHLNIEQGELLFADMAMRVEPSVSMMQVTRMTSFHPNDTQNRENSYTLARVIEYLNNPEVASKRESLREVLVR